MPGQMFLRTALTEQRIEDLEKQMARVMDHLGLNDAEPPPPDIRDPDSEWDKADPALQHSTYPAQATEKPPSKIAQKVAKRR